MKMEKAQVKKRRTMTKVTMMMMTTMKRKKIIRNATNSDRGKLLFATKLLSRVSSRESLHS